MRSCFALVGLLAPSVFASAASAERPGQSLLRFSDTEPPAWHTLEEKLALKAKHVKYIDVTSSWAGHTERLTKVAATQNSAARVLASFPPISQQATVNALIANLSTENLEGYLTPLTNFLNRFFVSEFGVAASNALYNTVSDIALDVGRTDVTVSQITHEYPDYPDFDYYQKSVVARIEGADPGAPIVILGSHLDTIGVGGRKAVAPGADDDGSGIITLLESYRALLQNGFKPSVPVEFHWYAAEEVGLVGSGEIVAKYADAGVPVRAMVEFDMTAYTPPGKTPAVTFVTDYVDASLTTYLASLVEEYLSIGFATTECGYGCSDHASWTSAGYPAAHPFETEEGLDNPNIHSELDTVDVPGFSFDQILEFTKLAVAVVVELAS